MPAIVDHDERRSSYARAAWAVIGDHGLVGTTMRDLASAAGVTTGALTHYFESKQQLVERALEQLASDTLERTSQVAVSDTDDLADLILLALPATADTQTEWKTWIALWSECARGNAAALSLNERFDARWLEVLASALTTLGHAEPEAAAHRLAMTINGVGIDACLSPAKWPTETLAEFATDLARRG